MTPLVRVYSIDEGVIIVSSVVCFMGPLSSVLVVSIITLLLLPQWRFRCLQLVGEQ